MIESAPLCWYAVRVTYSRELTLKEYLDKESVENFIPLRYKEVLQKERLVKKLVPVVHNLVFIRSTRAVIDDIKSRPEVELRSPIRYIMNKVTHSPLIIPEKQMQDFIAVAGTYDEQLVYLDPTSVSLRKGDQVRIIGGPFVGVEGRLTRIKGDRRVVVSIEGVVAVATAFVHPSMVEKVNNSSKK